MDIYTAGGLTGLGVTTLLVMNEQTNIFSKENIYILFIEGVITLALLFTAIYLAHKD